MADDGRVAFSTADPLVEADTNQKIDVYEFVDSHAQLITGGTGRARHPGRRRLLSDPAHRARGHQPRRRRPLLLDLRNARSRRPQRQLRQVLRRAQQRRLPGPGRPAPLHGRGRMPRGRERIPAAARIGNRRRPGLGGAIDERRRTTKRQYEAEKATPTPPTAPPPQGGSQRWLIGRRETRRGTCAYG